MAESNNRNFGARSTADDVVDGLDLSGKNAIVTGGSSGIGVETAQALAKRGAHVILAVRDVEKGKAVAENIKKEAKSDKVEVMKLDLESFAGVREFAAAFAEKKMPLHILINNAGIMACPHRLVEGYESQFAVCHLAHFLLANLLVPQMKEAKSARVVAVSSIANKRGGIHWEDINFEKDYNKWRAYAQAKSANILFALDFNRRYASQGITANSLHPGGIMTGLQKDLSREEMEAFGWIDKEGKLHEAFKTPAQGAATSVYVATAPELEGKGGQYFEDCQVSVGIAPPEERRGLGEWYRDAEKEAVRLWELSEKAVGQQFRYFGYRSTADDVVSGLDLSGKNMIVTGGASGIGVETATALAKRGAHVILAARDLEKGKAVAETIKKEAKSDKVEAMKLDLESFASVREFAAAFAEKKMPLHVLICNAGIMACPYSKVEGYESQFAVNHLAHFLLANLLLPQLKEAKSARVVVVSSMANKRGGMQWDDINFEKNYDKWRAYAQSKSANVLFAIEFTKRYASSGITANALHPGGIMTPLQKHLPKEEMIAFGWVDENGKVNDMFKTPAQGAATSTYLATAPEMEGKGGQYFEDCRPSPSGLGEWIKDAEADAPRLWELSEKAVGLTSKL